MLIQTIDCGNSNAATQFDRSLKDTGFAVLENHGIPLRCLHELYDNWRDFFLDDSKYDYRVSPQQLFESQAGYYPPELSETAVGSSVKDLKEFFHVRPRQSLPPLVAAITEEYRIHALKLGEQLIRWLQDRNSGTLVKLEKPLSSLLCADASLLRVLHYPPLDGTPPKGAMRAAAHEDINLITLLPAAREPGLEVMDSKKQWHRVSTDTDQIIINSGDMLAELSDGQYPSTTHRVTNPTVDLDQGRISAPYFLTPNLDTPLSPQRTAGEYLQQRLKEITR